MISSYLKITHMGIVVRMLRFVSNPKGMFSNAEMAGILALCISVYSEVTFGNGPTSTYCIYAAMGVKQKDYEELLFIFHFYK